MMEEAIRNFPRQFEWVPEIENGEKLQQKKVYIVAGMGGSHLAADLVQAWNPRLDVVVLSDYDLSGIPDSVLQESLVIANSYSGNTEEPLSVFEEAQQKGLPLAAITTGGKLLELAKAYAVPYIIIPDTGIQPRSALGFVLKAHLEMMGQDAALKETSELATKLSSAECEEKGRELAETLEGKVPIIYSSTKNRAVAYNWKIKFNETGKIPAFFNVLPELNHNEMTGFDVVESTKSLSANMHFIFLNDSKDDPRIQKRMEVLQQLYKERRLGVTLLELKEDSVFLKIFSSLLLADWTAYYTAQHYGVEANDVPMVEEFKKRI